MSWRFSMNPWLGPLEALELGMPGQNEKVECVFHPQSPQRHLGMVTVPGYSEPVYPEGSEEG